jgi:hypothetical protein
MPKAPYVRAAAATARLCASACSPSRRSAESWSSTSLTATRICSR